MEELFPLIIVNKTRNSVFNFAAMELRNTLFVVTVVRDWNKMSFKSMGSPERGLVSSG